MSSFAIFKQLPPVLQPGKRLGEESWVAALLYMGNVQAKSSEDAIEAGRKFCAYPIVQRGAMQ